MAHFPSFSGALRKTLQIVPALLYFVLCLWPQLRPPPPEDGASTEEQQQQLPRLTTRSTSKVPLRKRLLFYAPRLLFLPPILAFRLLLLLFLVSSTFRYFSYIEWSRAWVVYGYEWYLPPSQRSAGRKAIMGWCGGVWDDQEEGLFRRVWEPSYSEERHATVGGWAGARKWMRGTGAERSVFPPLAGGTVSDVDAEGAKRGDPSQQESGFVRNHRTRRRLDSAVVPRAGIGGGGAEKNDPFRTFEFFPSNTKLESSADGFRPKTAGSSPVTATFSPQCLPHRPPRGSEKAPSAQNDPLFRMVSSIAQRWADERPVRASDQADNAPGGGEKTSARAGDVPPPQADVLTESPWHYPVLSWYYAKTLAFREGVASLSELVRGANNKAKAKSGAGGEGRGFPPRGPPRSPPRSPLVFPPEFVTPELEFFVAGVMMKRLLGEFEKRGVRYAIAAGGLLGLERHGGWPQWDHDMDVAMPVEDIGRAFEAVESVKTDEARQRRRFQVKLNQLIAEMEDEAPSTEQTDSILRDASATPAGAVPPPGAIDSAAAAPSATAGTATASNLLPKQVLQRVLDNLDFSDPDTVLGLVDASLTTECAGDSRPNRFNGALVSMKASMYGGKYAVTK